MKMTTCPKCQSPNVFVSKDGVGFDWKIKIRTDAGMAPTMNWETYLCTDCGYFENYLIENEWLGKIKAGDWKNWQKVK
jgi:predicted nucleic-acid-binding Zn-ribbon protein